MDDNNNRSSSLINVKWTLTGFLHFSSIKVTAATKIATVFNSQDKKKIISKQSVSIRKVARTLGT